MLAANRFDHFARNFPPHHVVFLQALVNFVAKILPRTRRLRRLGYLPGGSYARRDAQILLALVEFCEGITWVVGRVAGFVFYCRRYAVRDFVDWLFS